MKETQKNTLPFFTSIFQIIVIDSVLVFLISWIFGGIHLVSNFYFFSSAALLIVSIFPFLTEGGINGFYRNRKKGLVITNAPDEIKRKKEERIDRLISSLAFGVSGIIAFFLSILSSKLI